jgi:hypothetical protein
MRIITPGLRLQQKLKRTEHQKEVFRKALLRALEALDEVEQGGGSLTAMLAPSTAYVALKDIQEILHGH